MSKQIIACVDGSTYTQAVCDWAAFLGERLSNPISLLHVLEKQERHDTTDLSGFIGLGSREHLLEELVRLDEKRGRLKMEQGKNILEKAQQYIMQKGALEVSTRQRHGTLVDSLTELTDETRIIIIGHHGQDGLHAASQIGNHVETVIRTQYSPILVAQETFKKPSQMMLAYDASPTARLALDKLIGAKLLERIPCHLVMVGESDQRALDEAAEKLKNTGSEVHTALLKGDVEQALWGYVATHQIDLMVMGAYGHSRIRQFFVGSNTTRMLVSAKIPLVLMR